MTTCRDIIIRGLQLARVVPFGDDPDAAEIEGGLVSLQDMYESFAVDGMFGTLQDVIVNGDYTASPGERLRVGSGTVTIPNTTLEDGVEYPPFDLSYIEVIRIDTPERQRHLYEAGRGAWVRIDDVTMDSEAPLATRGRDGLAACFAMHYCTAFGGDLSAAYQSRAYQFMGSLSEKAGGDRNKIAPDYF